jgi:hypothetical protein
LAQDIVAEDTKSCDTDRGGCDAPAAIQHFLVGDPPAAFTMQLAWESQRQSGEDIAATMAAISEVC